MTIANESLWIYITTPADGAVRKFALIEIEGQEQISGLFYYKLTLRTDDRQVNFKKLMGQSVTAHLKFMDKDNTRYINGMVTRFMQGHYDGGMVTYYAEIRPWLWELTLCSNNKIFQNKKATDIISSVFSSAGFTDFKNSTSGSYASREYCVQYGETDFNFVSRLMEEEGIFYYFEHTAAKHTLVMADDAGAAPECPGSNPIKLKGVSPLEDYLIEDCTLEQELISHKYKTKDFNFETPDTNLLTSADGKASGSFTVYEYPGKFADTGKGETIATKRIESLEIPGKILRGRGYCRGFTAGYKFTFSEHYRDDVNDTYLLRHLSLHATDALYTNTFEAIPASVSFRPPRLAKKSRIHGTQTAIVVGKKGEEIWTDEYGRVRIQFHWDLDGKNDEKSTCWVRVAQIWAGKNWGTMFIPRIGTEVIVSFLEGDPDQPMIIGTVYNAAQTVPYSLPGKKNVSTIKTISTKKGDSGEKKGNEIRFDDSKKQEELFIHAEKDMNIWVENDQTTTIKKNRTVTINEKHDKLTVEKGNRTVSVDEGHEFLTVKKGNRVVKVSTGNETHQVKGKRSLTITGNETHTDKANFTRQVKGNFTHKVKGNYALTIDGNLTIDVKGSITIKSKKDMLHDSGMKMTHKAKTDLINNAGKYLTNKAKMNLTNDAGMNLSNKAKMNLTNKANMNLTNDAGINLANKAKVNLDNKANAMMTNKASAMQTIDGGGMLIVKGGMVKIN